MNIKSYQVGEVKFQYSPISKKWGFVTCGVEKVHTFLTNCPGGQETAEKVAKTINGALKRKGFIDALCRANVTRIVSPQY